MPRTSRSRHATPLRFVILLDPRVEEPVRPGRAQIARYLAATWQAISARRRPALQGNAVTADVIVVTDAEIAELNAAHMRHSGPTDVLSFPMLEYDHERRAFHLGEVIVSLDTARREARERGLPPDEELARYMVHGFLHLLGYDDDTRAHAKEMEAIQEKILKTVRSKP